MLITSVTIYAPHKEMEYVIGCDDVVSIGFRGNAFEAVCIRFKDGESAIYSNLPLAITCKEVVEEEVN